MVDIEIQATPEAPGSADSPDPRSSRPGAARPSTCKTALLAPQLVESGEIRGWWDRRRLEQVAENLVSNAIKYGRARPIEVVVRGDELQGVLEVRDQGIGISPADQERVFAQFMRAVPESECLGLGLWIARGLVEAHGGQIEVSSVLDVGSTFTVTLPRRPPEEQPRSPASPLVCGAPGPQETRTA
jgi:signal transduction histidine kinase